MPEQQVPPIPPEIETKFIAIPEPVCMDKRLSDKDKIVYGYLLQGMRITHRYGKRRTKSIKTIADEIGCSRESVKNSVKTLVAEGYIVRHKISGHPSVFEFLVAPSFIEWRKQQDEKKRLAEEKQGRVTTDPTSPESKVTTNPTEGDSRVTTDPHLDPPIEPKGIEPIGETSSPGPVVGDLSYSILQAEQGVPWSEIRELRTYNAIVGRNPRKGEYVAVITAMHGKPEDELRKVYEAWKGFSNYPFDIGWLVDIARGKNTKELVTRYKKGVKNGKNNPRSVRGKTGRREHTGGTRQGLVT